MASNDGRYYAQLAFVTVLVVIVSGVVLFGNVATDVDKIITFIGTLIPYAFLVGKTNQIAHQTNGKLDAKFNAVHDKLDRIDMAPEAPNKDIP